MSLDEHDRFQAIVHRVIDDPDKGLVYLPVLLELTDSDSAEVRITAAWVLCLLAEHHPSISGYLLNRLGDRSGPAVDHALAWIRQRWGDEEADRRGSKNIADSAGLEGGASVISTAGSGNQHFSSGIIDAGRSEDAVEERNESDDEDDEDDEDERDESTDATEQSNDADAPGNDTAPTRRDEVVVNGELTVDADAVHDVNYITRESAGRYARTYTAMGVIGGEQRSILIRTLVPPTRSGQTDGDTFEQSFRESVEQWIGLDDHDTVQTVYDWGAQPHPWMVLDHAVATASSVGQLPPELAFRAGLDVATAVARAHERGVTHGLLAPNTVLFDRGESRPVARVRDFGFLDVYRSADGPLPIDRRYAAPELQRNDWQRVDWMSDIFQLGATLYTLFTGRPPDRSGDATEEDETGIPDGIATPPTELVEELPVAADRIVAKSMATPKIARYESVEELTRDLRSTLAEFEGEQ